MVTLHKYGQIETPSIPWHGNGTEWKVTRQYEGKLTVGTNREGHEGLAGRRIVGGLRTKAQGVSVKNAVAAAAVHHTGPPPFDSRCSGIIFILRLARWTGWMW